MNTLPNPSMDDSICTDSFPLTSVSSMADYQLDGLDDDLPPMPEVSDVEHEMDNIQADLEELIDCLDDLVQEESNSEDSEDEDIEIFMHKLRASQKLQPYLVEDSANGCKRINWENFGPFVDGIVDDLHRLKNLNRRTNDVVRRIRNISVYDDLPIEEHNKDNGDNVDDAVSGQDLRLVDSNHMDWGIGAEF